MPLVDAFGRGINYLRISITDECSLRCVYCRPMRQAGEKPGADQVSGARQMPLPRAVTPLLPYQQLLTVARAAAGVGFTHFRITGGEPLVRPGVVDFVQEMARIPGVKDLSMSTNGLALARLAEPLTRAGLRRVNISFDSLRPERFRLITRGGNLRAVWNGIRAALAAGLRPVKLNMVVLRGINDDEVAHMARLTLSYPFDIRFIELMPLGPYYRDQPHRFVSAREVQTRLAAAGLTLVPARTAPPETPPPPALPQAAHAEPTAPTHARPEDAGPARYYRLPGAVGRVGFITAMSDHFCGECNRIRLAADGKLYPCLADTGAVDLRPALDAGADQDEIARLIIRAVMSKPMHHHMHDYAERDYSWREMSRVGG